MNKIIFYFLLIASGLCYADPGDLTSKVVFDKNGKKAAIAKVLEENIDTHGMKNWKNSDLNQTLSKLAKQYTPETLYSMLISISEDDIPAQIDFLVEAFGLDQMIEENIANTSERKIIELVIKDKGMWNLVKRGGLVINEITACEESHNADLMLKMVKNSKDIKTTVKNNPEFFINDNIYNILNKVSDARSVSEEKILMDMADILINAKKDIGDDVLDLENKYADKKIDLNVKDWAIFNGRLNEFCKNLGITTRSFDKILDRMIQDEGKLPKESQVKFFFGTPSRNFQDGLLYQARDSELKGKVLFLSLLVLGNNDFIKVNNKQIKTPEYFTKVILKGGDDFFSKDLSLLTVEDMMKVGVKKELAERIYKDVSKIELELELGRKGLE